MVEQFDVGAATAGYLAQLPAAVHAKAQAYTQGGHWLLLWGALAAVAVAWIVLRSGLLSRVRSAAERGRRRPKLAVAGVAAAWFAAAFVLTLPWDAYAHWWREGRYGLTAQPFGAWLGEQALSLVVLTLGLTALLELLYLLIRRAPRTWWAWSGGVVALFIVFVLAIAPVVVEPLFNTYRPAPPGPVRDAIVEMARANGVPADKIVIYDGSKQSNRYTANVSGLCGTARIAMSDTMFRQGADLDEIRAVVGHEMGHYVRGHVFEYAAAYGLMALAALFLADRLYPRVLRWTGAKGVGGIEDPAGYPVIAMILAVLGLLATPLLTSTSRLGEADADSFSLERANAPDGMARALLKTVEYRAATPSPLEEIIFYDHPSVGGRIRKAMVWKASHPPAQRFLTNTVPAE